MQQRGDGPDEAKDLGVRAASPVDVPLATRLRELTIDDKDFWSFAQHPRSRGGRDAYIYPAMMVAPMQGTLLELLVEHRGGAQLVLDPFVGSGTTLEESMRLGCGFVGIDINPMGVLLCRLKAEPQYHQELQAAVPRIIARAGRDRRGVAEGGGWLGKWYRDDVALRLSRLRRAIRHEPDVVIRRPLWVALAEVARTSGNMRLSTPKLQTRPPEQLDRPIDIAASFVEAATVAGDEMRRHATALEGRRLLKSWGYDAPLHLLRADIREATWPADRKADIVLSSPPYGDNHTTMPYGQHSYLPLQWIDLDDIAPGISEEVLAASKRLDTLSLGGSRRIDANGVAYAADVSPLLQDVLARLAGRRFDWARVASFFADLDAAVERMLDWCADDAHMVWTVGDRTVAGLQVRTTDILAQLLAARGVVEVTRLQRRIGRNKRLAPRNGYAASTISTETVLVMKRLLA